MRYGLPVMSYLGYPMSVPCAAHAGLGFREANRTDSTALVEHLISLSPEDRRNRFCATVNDATIVEHVNGLWDGKSMVVAAYDGPIWASPMRPAGPVRAMIEVSLGGESAEVALTVDDVLRRRGVGTYLVQTAAWLLRSRGIRKMDAYTLPGNRSFLSLSIKAGARIEHDQDEVWVDFDVDRLAEAYLKRRFGDLSGIRAA